LNAIKNIECNQKYLVCQALIILSNSSIWRKILNLDDVAVTVT